jgi:thiol-disulfide isomerase/thioredoxin
MPGLLPIDTKGLKRAIAKNKGKVVVVNFWASWCVPCKQEFPELVAAVKASGATLITVACDTPQDAVTKSAKFLALQGATANAYVNTANTDIAAFLKWLEPKAPPASPIPRTYLFSRSGKLVKALAGKHDGATFAKEISTAKAAT